MSDGENPDASASTAVCSDDWPDRCGSVLHTQVCVALRAATRLSGVSLENTNKRQPDCTIQWIWMN